MWASVGVAVSVHTMACWPLVTHGTTDQQKRWRPDMLGGALLGDYCLSEADAGSDPAAMRARAMRVDAATGSPAPRPGSRMAAKRTSTPCSRGPATARRASRASWHRVPAPDSRLTRPSTRWA